MSSYCDLTLFSDLKFAFKSIRLFYKIFDFVHTVSLLSFDVCQNFIDNFKGIWVAAAVKKESKNTMLRRRKVQTSWGGGGWGGGLLIQISVSVSILFSISAKSGRAMAPLALLVPPRFRHPCYGSTIMHQQKNEAGPFSPFQCALCFDICISDQNG